MKIKKVTITKEERNQAVQEWLERNYRISLKVTDVEPDYSYSLECTVEFEDPERVKASPPMPNVPELESETQGLPDIKPLNHTLATLDAKVL